MLLMWPITASLDLCSIPVTHAFARHGATSGSFVKSVF
jgi:hypothetical protein